MKKKVSSLTAWALLLGLASCSTRAPTADPQRRDLAAIQAEQAALTPANVLESLRRGNERFATGKTRPRDMLHNQRVTATGQYPHAVILSCIDSRAPADALLAAILQTMTFGEPIRVPREASETERLQLRERLQAVLLAGAQEKCPAP